MIITEQDFLNIIKELEISSPEFLKFMEGKVKRYPVKDLGWGCFPLLDENQRLVDIRVLVPNFFDELCVRINIHEFAHAFELYNELGKTYIEDTEIREANAKKKN